MSCQAQVLIIEDEKEILSILAETIEDEDFTVATATNAQEAIDVLEKGPVKVIFCDQNMGPGMSGLEFFESYLSKRKPVIPFYLMTGDVTHSNDSLQGVGAAGVVPKPFDVDMILEAIDKHVSS